ncbi:VENN motif pre-toxin domain-containing protein [Gallibacterium anatis]|nr:VENN motif pre-toxin domain-containing protein [Gallibacterium anatis]WIM82655.1 VENN motif pre-toxin domain-containing protein [Gallibacterium anatis]
MRAVVENKNKSENLSQLASGLVGGLVGDSTSSAISAAEIGKRAVEDNYLSKEEAENFIDEYNKAKSISEKREVLKRYLIKSKDNDAILNSICINNPIACIESINSAKVGKEILLENQDKFSLSPYYTAILSSNYAASNNTDWTEFHLSNLIPSFTSITPNQELADKLAKGISSGTVLLTKKSADLLYQLNTNPRLKIQYDPSNIHVVGEINNKSNQFSGRVYYSDINNWSVIGSVSGKKRDDGSYHIYDDKYDFDIRGKYLGRPLNLIRDIETFIGEPKGGGTEYFIEFDRDKGVIYEEKD